LGDVLSSSPVLLAPMEDISDIAFRAICRAQGADLTYTEFVNVEGLLHNCRIAARKIALAPGEWPVGIQIYGANPATLVEAAQVAEQRGPTLIDINCGCWVPRIAARGAGSGWLRNLPAMEAMVRAVVRAVAVPVTVKTRIGWGDGEPPVVEIVRRLEDAGAAAITLHCRTALQRHEGAADWSWAARAQEAVGVPVILNGGVSSAADAVNAFRQTGCAGVMVARAAIGNPWIFAEAAAALAAAGLRPAPLGVASGDPLPYYAGATPLERLAVCKEHYRLGVDLRGERVGVCATRRHLVGYLRGVPDGAALRDRLNHEPTLKGCLALLDDHAATLRARRDHREPRAS
jgi:nifR3 family TIM-barrel protein